jgi:glycosyltransferase involved in cell wall biosynthesis
MRARVARASGRDLSLVFAGRVEPEKGLGRFIQAIARVDGWRLTVLGEGSAMDAVRAVVRENGLGERVEFGGRVSRAAALERIAASDVLVLPSLVYENAPLVMFEALACGTGLLVSDLGGMAEVVTESGVGWTFDPMLAESMEAALVRAMAEMPSLGATNERVRGLIEARSVEKYCERLEKLYTDGNRGSSCGC